MMAPGSLNSKAPMNKGGTFKDAVKLVSSATNGLGKGKKAAGAVMDLVEKDTTVTEPFARGIEFVNKTENSVFVRVGQKDSTFTGNKTKTQEFIQSTQESVKQQDEEIKNTQNGI